MPVWLADSPANEQGASAGPVVRRLLDHCVPSAFESTKEVKSLRLLLPAPWPASR